MTHQLSIMKISLPIKMALATVALVITLDAAAYDLEIDGVYYNVISFVGSTCEVTFDDQTNTKYQGVVTIPDKIAVKNRTLDVVAIGAKAFYGCTQLTSVTIPQSVTTIGANAFYRCNKLT